MKLKRILAIQIKRIGDLILTAPALTRLKRERPDAEITLVTVGAAGQLAPAIPAVDEHLNYRYGRPNLALWSSVMGTRFDTVLDFSGTDRSALLAFLSGAEVAATYGKRARTFPRSWIFSHFSRASLKTLHTVDHMVALLDAVGLPPQAEPEPVRMEIPPAVEARVDEMLAGLGLDRPFAVVHPGTAREEKYWGAGRWARVMDYVAAGRGWPVVITGGSDPAEEKHIGEILARTGKGTEIAVLAGKLNLLETASVIHRAALALGVDTAAMHLAGAFAVPQVVLFGPTNPYHWRPRHPRARVILSGHPEPLREEEFEMRIEERSMDAIAAGHVIGAIESLG